MSIFVSFFGKNDYIFCMWVFYLSQVELTKSAHFVSQTIINLLAFV